MFQFPFPRDSFCNMVKVDAKGIRYYSFSSLFLGIPFATCPRVCPRLSSQYLVSVPFSSGFLLQHNPYTRVDASRMFRFSSLFLGIPFATSMISSRSRTPWKSFSSLFLGIPFATLANMYGLGKMLEAGFSSLFLGIPFATPHRPTAAIWVVSFSSLFLGIPFATALRPHYLHQLALVSVPFSSGFLLQPRRQD